MLYPKPIYAVEGFVGTHGPQGLDVGVPPFTLAPKFVPSKYISHAPHVSFAKAIAVVRLYAPSYKEATKPDEWMPAVVSAFWLSVSRFPSPYTVPFGDCCVVVLAKQTNVPADVLNNEVLLTGE